MTAAEELILFLNQQLPILPEEALVNKWFRQQLADRLDVINKSTLIGPHQPPVESITPEHIRDITNAKRVVNTMFTENGRRIVSFLLKNKVADRTVIVANAPVQYETFNSIMEILVPCGIVSKRRSGIRVFYAVNQKNLRKFLQAAALLTEIRQ